jgi:thiamine biosynthesis protein ThiS
VTVQINGEERDVAPGLTVAALLDEIGIRPGRVVVELNHSVLSREALATTLLNAGDQIEIVHFVGGG